MKDNNTMYASSIPTPKDSVKQELAELALKITDLTNILFSEHILELNLSECMIDAMRDQLYSMEQYARALQRRLFIWDKTDEEIKSMCIGKGEMI